MSRDKFLSYIQPKGHILDLGCGVGQDTKYFLELGYRVTAVEQREDLCQIAAGYTGISICKAEYTKLDFTSCFDGVWARGSLSEVSRPDLQLIFQQIMKVLKLNGYAYFSFKYGYFTKASFEEFCGRFGQLEIVEIWVDYDNRPCSCEKWLNVIVKVQKPEF